MSQPDDPYRRLEATRAAPPPFASSDVSAGASPPETPDAPDPWFWGESPSRTAPGRGLGRGHAGSSPFDRLHDRLRDRLRDGLSTLRGDARVGLAALVAVAVVAGVVWYRVGSGGAATPQRSAPSRAGSRGDTGASTGATRTSEPGEGASGSGAPTTAGNRVVVHVAGAVARPGVVELASGSRVIDALESAGGGLPEADLDRLNLAAKVVDGQRVLVQRVGDPPAAADGSGSASPSGAGSATPGAATAGPLNLNTATLDQLDGLPGIGPVLAAAILAERVRRGAFKSVNELRDVRGIGEQRFADLRELVAV